MDDKPAVVVENKYIQYIILLDGGSNTSSNDNNFIYYS